MGILDKAKDKAHELKESAATKAQELKDSAAHKAQEIKDSATAKLNEAAESVLVKVKESLAEFNATLPIIKSAGYTVGGVKIELGISPKIVAAFKSTEAVSDEVIEQVIAANQEKKLAVMLVKSLHHARQLQESIDIGGLKPKGIAVTIGILPVVSIDFG